MNEHPHRGDALRRLVLDGRVQEAFDLFPTLPSPTPRDLRFAGLAAFNLGHTREAKALLSQAIGLGEAAGHIELACLYRHAGDLRLARRLLDVAAAQPALNAFDHCMLLFEQSALRKEEGNRDEAMTNLEEAWVSSFTTEDGRSLQPGIAQALGNLLAEAGLDERAADNFDLAVRYGLPGRRTNARLARARAYTYSGLYAEAQHDLQVVASELPGAPILQALYHYNLGVLRRMLGDRPGALEAFELAARTAQQAEQHNTWAYALLAVASVHVSQGDPNAARQSLSAARRHGQSDRLRLYMRFREGTLATLLGDPHAAEVLREVAQEFERGGCFREAAWANLHLADACRRQGQPDAMWRALRVATDHRHVIGNGAPLRGELLALPELAGELAQTSAAEYCHVLLADVRAEPPSDAPSFAQQVQVRALGTPCVMVDGQTKRFELARSVEILIYMLLRGRQTLSKIIGDLFPDSDVKLAKNYFHQARYDLARTVPGLSVSFDRETNDYGVTLENIQVEFDVRDVLNLNEATGPDAFLALTKTLKDGFLPMADTEWASDVRSDVAQRAMLVGLKLVARALSADQHIEAFELADRLHHVEPLNELLVKPLVESAVAGYGPAFALSRLHAAERHFLEEVGEAPRIFEDLKCVLSRAS